MVGFERPTIHFFLWSARQILEALVSQRALYTGPQRLPSGGRDVALRALSEGLGVGGGLVLSEDLVKHEQMPIEL